MRAWWRSGGLAAAALAAFGCKLSEITIAEPAKTVVAEAYVEVGVRDVIFPDRKPAYNQIVVVLHATLDASGRSGPVDGARITVTRPRDGLTIPVGYDLFGQDSTNLGDCVSSYPPGSTGTCYIASRDVNHRPGLDALSPDDTLSLRIELADGRVLTSETVIPGRFELRNVTDGGLCTIAPRTGTNFVWSRSDGAWAYVADTYIAGLGRAFPGAHDPLYLFGLSVSAADTTIVFPREFGVFERGSLDHDVATALQLGLPDSTVALVTITAVDRNWVNWARGGNFNPSGIVRVPSIQGGGTGVFGSGVLRQFAVTSDSRGGTFPPCPPDSPPPGIHSSNEQNHSVSGITGR